MISKFIMIGTLPTFFGGIFISLLISLFFGHYELDYTISHLGSIIATPIPWFFNFTLIISSILLFFFFLNFYDNLQAKFVGYKKTYTIAFIFFLMGSIFLAYCGIFTIDFGPIIHTTYAVLMFGSFFFGESLIGILHVIKHEISTISVITYVVIVIGGIGYFILHIPFFEWVFFGSLVAFNVPLIIKAVKKSP